MVKKYVITALFALVVLIPHFAHADITSNLIDWWKVDEGSGTAPADSGSGGHTGTFTGTPTWITGKIGPFALQFVGASSQRVSFGTIDTAFDSTANATICAWVNRPATSNFIAIGSGDSNTVRFNIQWYSDGNIYFTFGNGSSVQYSFASLNVTGWHHVCEVFNGSLVGNARSVSYIDGAAASLSYAGTPPATLGTSANMGNVYMAYDNTVSYGTGSVDDMRLYSRSLSSADVAELYAYPPAVVSGAPDNANNFIQFQ